MHWDIETVLFVTTPLRQIPHFIPHTNPTPSDQSDTFYGVYHETVALLIGGYAVAFVGLWRTSTHFRAAGVAALTWVCLRAIAILLFILLATLYNRGAFLNWTHMIAGVLGALSTGSGPATRSRGSFISNSSWTRRPSDWRVDCCRLVAGLALRIPPPGRNRLPSRLRVVPHRVDLRIGRPATTGVGDVISMRRSNGELIRSEFGGCQMRAKTPARNLT